MQPPGLHVVRHHADAPGPPVVLVHGAPDRSKNFAHVVHRLSDLPVTPSSEVWDEVSAEPDLCTRLKCPHFDRCFLFRARRRAAEADVVVVNHHLLAADLSVRQASDNWQEAAVLPPYRRLILDEAHHLEDVAANHLGIQVTSRAVRRLLTAQMPWPAS